MTDFSRFNSRLQYIRRSPISGNKSPKTAKMSYEDGHHSHGHSHSHGSGDDHIPPTPTSAVQNLREYVDFDRLTALNSQQTNEELQFVFRAPNDRFSVHGVIESDSDSQLILNIPFTGNVKLYSLILRTHSDPAHCPRTVKLFKNNRSLDFDNVSDTKPQLQVDQPLVGVQEANNDEETFVEHHLPRSQFQSTHHLTIFFENNWEDDDETIKVFYIELRGVYTSALSKDPVIALYESAANPSDHKNMLQEEVSRSIN